MLKKAYLRLNEAVGSFLVFVILLLVYVIIIFSMNFVRDLRLQAIICLANVTRLFFSLLETIHRIHIRDNLTFFKNP